jgi:hypothetical protein
MVLCGEITFSACPAVVLGKEGLGGNWELDLPAGRQELQVLLPHPSQKGRGRVIIITSKNAERSKREDKNK